MNIFREDAAGRSLRKGLASNSQRQPCDWEATALTHCGKPLLLTYLVAKT
jgi:hypothetical protein